MAEGNMIRLTGLWRATFLILMFVLLPGQALAESYPFFPWGNFWNAMSKQERIRFLEGYEEGYSKGEIDAVGEIINPDRKEIDTDTIPEKTRLSIKKILKRNAFRNFDKETIRDLVSNFYKDPANSYVTPSNIIEIAIEKLEGKSSKEIEKKLESERRGVKVMREFIRKELEERRK